MTFTLKKIKRDKAVVGLVGLVERPTTSSDGIFQNKILVLFGGLLLLSSPNQILLPVPHPAWALVAAPRSEATNQSAPPRCPGSPPEAREPTALRCVVGERSCILPCWIDRSFVPQDLVLAMSWAELLNPNPLFRGGRSKRFSVSTIIIWPANENDINTRTGKALFSLLFTLFSHLHPTSSVCVYTTLEKATSTEPRIICL